MHKTLLNMPKLNDLSEVPKAGKAENVHPLCTEGAFIALESFRNIIKLFGEYYGKLPSSVRTGTHFPLQHLGAELACKELLAARQNKLTQVSMTRSWSKLDTVFCLQWSVSGNRGHWGS